MIKLSKYAELFVKVIALEAENDKIKTELQNERDLTSAKIAEYQRFLDEKFRLEESSAFLKEESKILKQQVAEMKQSENEYRKRNEELSTELQNERDLKNAKTAECQSLLEQKFQLKEANAFLEEESKISKQQVAEMKQSESEYRQRNEELSREMEDMCKTMDALKVLVANRKTCHNLLDDLNIDDWEDDDSGEKVETLSENQSRDDLVGSVKEEGKIETVEWSLLLSFKFIDDDLSLGLDPIRRKVNLADSQWIGLDRYHCNMYGVRFYYKVEPSPIAIFQLKKLCLFTRKMSTFKMVALRDLFYDVLSKKEFYGVFPIHSNATISKNGDFIMASFKWRIRRSRTNGDYRVACIKCVFCCIEVETGIHQTYQVNGDARSVVGEGDERYWITVSDNNECFLTTFLGSHVGFYDISLDKECGEAVLTKLSEFQYYQDIAIGSYFFGNKMASFFAHFDGDQALAKMLKFNTATNQWSNSSYVLTGVLSPELACPLVFSQNGSLFAFVVEFGLAIEKYDEKQDLWSRIDVNLQDCVPFGWNSDNLKSMVACSGPELAVLINADGKESQCILANINNVLPLKDICFIKWYSACINCINSQNISGAIFLLPHSLKRRYFGPSFVLDY